MKKRITISIDKGFYEAAKIKAEENGRSLSNYVEGALYAAIKYEELTGETIHRLVKDLLAEKIK